MAKGKAVLLERAEAVADEVVARLAPACEWIQVAGSIRRGRPEVHDVDLVLIPRTATGLLGSERDLATLRSLVEGLGEAKTNSEKIWKLHMPELPVDLYLATPETRATLLLIRTGSAQHNIYLAMSARRLGMQLHADGSGLTDARGQLVPIWREKEVFSRLELPYVEPKHREYPPPKTVRGGG